MTQVDNEHKNREEHSEEFQKEVGKKALRKLKARREKGKDTWFWLGMFGLVGWSVAIPTLIGIAVGVWLDKKLDDTVSWTLTFLFIGIILGCLNAWYWVKKESSRE